MEGSLSQTWSSRIRTCSVRDEWLSFIKGTPGIQGTMSMVRPCWEIGYEREAYVCPKTVWTTQSRR